jgi:hypothetical protein
MKTVTKAIAQLFEATRCRRRRAASRGNECAAFLVAISLRYRTFDPRRGIEDQHLLPARILADYFRVT